jgi:hypothetical protein
VEFEDDIEVQGLILLINQGINTQLFNIFLILNTFDCGSSPLVILLLSSKRDLKELLKSSKEF